MTYEMAGFKLGQKVKHPRHGIGEICELDAERGIIWCNYPNIGRWVSMPSTLEIVQEPILIPPCTHPEDNLVTIQTSDLIQESKRYNAGKIQTREVDPDFIMGIGEVLTKSRAKYEAFNWQKDTPFSVPYESLLRHLMAFQKGEELDKESGCHHLLHVATNIMFLYYHRNNVKMDDRGFKEKK
jgi:hypothetical protein